MGSRSAGMAYAAVPSTMTDIPNMKVYSRYYCFACNCTGDMIDFTSFLFHMELTKAALKLAEDFGVAYEYKGRPSERLKRRVEKNQSVVRMEKKTDEQVLKKKCVKATRVYPRYRSDLNDQKERLAPKRREEEWPKDFVTIFIFAVNGGVLSGYSPVRR